MSYIDFENLINPTGSVHHNEEDHRGLSDREFDHSANNPAMALIDSMLGSGNYNKDDVADLYDKANQWEIDQATWLNQLKVDQAIKEEQREYDSPLQQIARERAAGINRDVQNGNGGSGGGGTAGTSAGAGISTNTGGVGNTDNYAGRNFTLAAIQTAANVAQGLTDCYSSIVNSHAQMQMLPSQISLANSTAQLNSAQANEIETLLRGKKDYQSLVNDGVALQNSTAILSQLDNMRGYLTPDSDVSPILKAMGVEEGNIPLYQQAFKEMMATPYEAAKYNRGQVQQTMSEVERTKYTSEYFGRIIDKQMQLEELGLDCSIVRDSMSYKMNRLLNNDEYINNLAETELTKAETAKLAADQIKTELMRDIDVYFQTIEFMDKEIEKMEKRQVELRLRALDNKRPLGAEEKAEYDLLEKQIPEMKSKRSQELSDVYRLAGEWRRNAYYLDSNLGYNQETGKVTKGLDKENNTLHYGQVYYGQTVYGAASTYEHKQILVNAVTNTVNTLTTIYAVNRYAKGMSTNRSIEQHVQRTPYLFDQSLSR